MQVEGTVIRHAVFAVVGGGAGGDGGGVGELAMQDAMSRDDLVRRRRVGWRGR